MVAHSLPRTAKIFEETTFATPPADWAASGTRVFVIDPDTTNLKQAIVENNNIRERALGVHEAIKTLRNSSSSFSAYLHSSPANAAEAGAAVEIPLMTMLHNAMGGLHLSSAIGVASGTASAPVVDDDTDLAVYDFVFAYDASTGIGDWYYITDLPGAAEVTLDRDLHFTPDAADVFHASGNLFLHEASITQHDHAQHKTLSMLIQGQGAEDAVDCSGVKLSATIEPITAGEPMTVSFEAAVTTFRSETLSKVALTGAIAGEQGLVPGIANTTKLRLAAVGDPLAVVRIRGAITPSMGVSFEPDVSPAGTEGVNGYVGTGFGETMLELLVDQDDDYVTDWRAGTHYHVLITVGTTPAGSVGLYYPNLEIHEEPVRVDEGGIASTKLVLRARDSVHDTTGLTGDALEKALSPFHLLLVA